MPNVLTRDQILSADDLKTETVSVPEWGGHVKVRTMTGAERDAYEARSLVKRGESRELNLVNMRARLAADTIVDNEGKRLFTESDVGALGGKSAAALDRVFGVAMKLNGMSKEDVDELAKN